MNSYTLENFFNPKNIAVIGASDRSNSVGQRVFANLREDKYQGQIFPINPKHKTVQGQPAYPSVLSLPSAVELAIIATPASTIPEILHQCGDKGIKNVLILSAGFKESGEAGKQLEKSIKSIAQDRHIRLMGPNCLGMILPHIHLNATFSQNKALAGNLGLISQSGAICTAILDWAFEKKIGFSGIFSLGNAIDIDFGEVLNYLALDPNTQSILLYIESIQHARPFMSGLRMAARIKPVVVIKAGRNGAGAKAAVSHTGALIGSDDVFDAALMRAGVVRVLTIEQLFSAAEILSKNYAVQNNRLALMTNGGGAGVMAADYLATADVNIAELSKKTLDYLNSILPPYWSHQNPIDILGDATSTRYAQAAKACLEDPNVDGLLVMLAPVALAQPTEVAEEIITLAKKCKKPILTCWLGEYQVKAARKLFNSHGIPTFQTPEMAIDAFSFLTQFYHNQQLLLQVPTPIAYQGNPDINGPKMIIHNALGENRKILTTLESKAILSAFDIATTQAIEAKTANDALIAAETIGFPVVMKILSPDITHKQDVGGVQINITNAQAVRATFKKMVETAQRKAPKAKILGVSIEKMRKEPNDRELMIGVFSDPQFGPVITFGAGGTIVEVMKDRTVALPPLNQFIAERMISQTRISTLLGEFRNMPKVNIDDIVQILLKVSNMVCELPHIKEMDINPLIVNERSAIAVDARIVVDILPPSLIPYDHMAIHPYPYDLVMNWQLDDGTDICIRPIRPEDIELEKTFMQNLSAESKYFRLMGNVTEYSPTTLMRMTQIDYDKEMSLIATIKQNGEENCIGVTSYTVKPDQETAEFSIVIADTWHHKGIGSHLLIHLLEIATARGIKTMFGEILATNLKMKQLAQRLDFSFKNTSDPSIIIAEKKLAKFHFLKSP